jgi:glycosyltransferase involved in cell wall biosynthesis
LVSDAKDDELDTLYENAAFCVYPSIYEGFGLPIIESFRHGKAVISSTGGALPEVVSGLSPCIDPLDEDAWFEAIRLWIESPAARADFEAAIRSRFRPKPWEETGREIFAALEDKLGDMRKQAQETA